MLYFFKVEVIKPYGEASLFSIKEIFFITQIFYFGFQFCLKS